MQGFNEGLQLVDVTTKKFEDYFNHNDFKRWGQFSFNKNITKQDIDGTINIARSKKYINGMKLTKGSNYVKELNNILYPKFDQNFWNSFNK